MKITVRGIPFIAIVCDRCKCRLWPHELLTAHLARHAIRDASGDDGDQPVLWRGREKGKAVRKVKHSKWDLDHYRRKN